MMGWIKRENEKNNRISEIDSSPFPHVVVDDFLDEDTLELVIDALAGLEYSFSESDLFSYWASVKLTDIDHPALNVLREDLEMRSGEKRFLEHSRFQNYQK